MPVSGVPAFNAIAILDVEAISFASKDVHLVAHAAFINMENGQSYGETTCSRWSPSTIERLQELRAAMELDVAAMVFETSSTGALTGSPVVHGASDGISEHAGRETDTEQA